MVVCVLIQLTAASALGVSLFHNDYLSTVRSLMVCLSLTYDLDVSVVGPLVVVTTVVGRHHV